VGRKRTGGQRHCRGLAREGDCVNGGGGGDWRDRTEGKIGGPEEPFDGLLSARSRFDFTLSGVFFCWCVQPRQ